MSQLNLFRSNQYIDLPLVDRMATLTLSVDPEHIPTTTDRWLLASNLQKSIRRGLVHTAVGTATRLLEIDASYLWRRLLVISYEDVGFGNIELCHDLLKTFRRHALHRQLGPERVAGYFTQELAVTCKSRALCDAIAMQEFSICRGEYEGKCFKLSDEQLVSTACNADMPIMDRVAALRHVCGYREFAQGYYRTLAPTRTELMREIANRLQLTEVETTLFISGQNISESLNIPLPIIAQMVRTAQQWAQRSEHVFDGKAGILYAALDRHTRIGKRCLAKLGNEVNSIKQFFGRMPAGDPVVALGVGVFIVESSALNCWREFDGAADMRQMFNSNFMEYAGISPNDQDELLDLVRSNLAHLNLIRAGEIG